MTGLAELQEAVAALSAEPTTAPGKGVTSDLSVDEVLLLHSIGWEPVDLVFGVSWWSVPWGALQWQTGVITEAVEAFGGAMDGAADQMRRECVKAGGAGVVGVRIELSVRARHIEVALVGTAVRRAGGAGVGSSHRPVFLSDLSARDFALLTRAGWMPAGLVAGASFVVAPRRSARDWAAQKRQNVELPLLTEALYLAREGAMEQLQRAGMALRADGVVGVKLVEGPLGTNARAMQFVAIGTAVQLTEPAHRPIRPTMVIPLDDAVVQFRASSLRAER